MWVSKTRVTVVDRRWRRIVFSTGMRKVFLVWLGIGTVGMLLGATTRTPWLTKGAAGVALPLLFISCAWMFASSLALQAAASFVRRDVLIGIWMGIWTAILGLVGVSGLMWLIYGLRSDAGR